MIDIGTFQICDGDDVMHDSRRGKADAQGDDVTQNEKGGKVIHKVMPLGQSIKGNEFQTQSKQSVMRICACSHTPNERTHTVRAYSCARPSERRSSRE